MILGDVKYELYELERFIADTNAQEVIKWPLHDKSLQVEVERIKQKLLREVISIEEERHLERYIQYHQQALIRLMDQTMSQIRTDKGKHNSFFKTYYAGLGNLLRFVEQYFPKYIDRDAVAPHDYMQKARKESLSYIRKLREKLADQQMNDLVLKLLLLPLNLEVNNSDQHLTYRQISYASLWQQQLQDCFDNVKEKLVEEELRKLMILLNLNAPDALAYFAEYIEGALLQTEDVADKIEKLSFILKNINQMQARSDIAYNRFSPPLKEQVRNHIEEEINYLEKIQCLNKRDTDDDQRLAEINDKIRIQASVAQLACFLKLLIDTKIVLNDNIMELIRFVVKSMITKKSEYVSFESLRTKYYNIETGTRASVKKMLLSMIQHLDKNMSG